MRGRPDWPLIVVVFTQAVFAVLVTAAVLDGVR